MHGSKPTTIGIMPLGCCLCALTSCQFFIVVCSAGRGCELRSWLRPLELEPLPSLSAPVRTTHSGTVGWIVHFSPCVRTSHLRTVLLQQLLSERERLTAEKSRGASERRFEWPSTENITNPSQGRCMQLRRGRGPSNSLAHCRSCASTQLHESSLSIALPFDSSPFASPSTPCLRFTRQWSDARVHELPIACGLHTLIRNCNPSDCLADFACVRWVRILSSTPHCVCVGPCQCSGNKECADKAASTQKGCSSDSCGCSKDCACCKQKVAGQPCKCAQCKCTANEKSQCGTGATAPCCK